MRTYEFTAIIAFLLCASLSAPAQRAEDEVPLMRPDERKVVDAQSDEFNKALEPILSDAAKSAVTIWTRGTNKPIAYGTVVGDGTSILTKWSEIERFADMLFVNGAKDQGAKAEVAGVFTEEDLVLLSIPPESARNSSL